MLAAGSRLGRYEVLFPIASGGMATVYAARAVGEGRFRKPVALKVPLPTLASQPRFRDMLMDEATLSACVTSPHVVSTTDLVREGDTVFLVMDLVVGVGLRALERRFLDRSPYAFPIPIALAILAQAARGLHDAHEARDTRGAPLQLVHRDVSPHNILVGVDGRARVADFGIAHAAHRLTTTKTGETKGKLAYFAPEQLVGERVDRRVDVFALGVVAYELLTGVRPFEGDNPLAIALNVAQKSVPPIHEIRPEVPREVSDLVAHAMVRDLDRRLATCAAFAESLERASGSVSLASIGALVRTEHSARVSAFERALALAADADDIAEIAGQLGTAISSENEEGAIDPEGAPTVVRAPDVAAPRSSSEFDPDIAPTAPLVLDTGAAPGAPAPSPRLPEQLASELHTSEAAVAPRTRAVSPLVVAAGSTAGLLLLGSVVTLGAGRTMALLLLVAMTTIGAWWWKQRA